MSSDLSARSSPSSSTASPSDDPRRKEQGRHATSGSGRRSRWRRRVQWLGGAAWALDPRARWVRDWNRAYLLACAAGLMVDPLFLYAVSLSGPLMCLFVDGWLAAAVTALRCAVDAMHVWNVATQLRIARGAGAAAQGSKPVAGGAGDEEQQQQQGAEEDDDEEAARKLPEDATPRKGMLLDFFVILPVMQVRCSASLDYSFTSQLACFSTWVMTTQ